MNEFDLPWRPLVPDRIVLDHLRAGIIAAKLSVEQSREAVRQTREVIASMERWQNSIRGTSN